MDGVDSLSSRPLPANGRVRCETKTVAALKLLCAAPRNAEEGKMDKVRRWSKNARAKILTCDRTNMDDVLLQLERYADDLRMQTAICRSFGEWKAMQEAVKSHFADLRELAASIGTNRLAPAYRFYEEIMAIYATITLKMVAVTFESENVQTQQGYSLLRATCTRLVAVMTDTFAWSDLNIANSLLKMQYDKKSTACMMLVGRMFHTVLFTLPTTGEDDVSLCANYVLFCKYKKFIPTTEHVLKTQVFLERHMRRHNRLSEIQMLKDIMGGCNYQDVDRVVASYFRYLRQHAERLQMGASQDAFERRTVIYLKPPSSEPPSREEEAVEESTVAKTEAIDDDEEARKEDDAADISVLKQETSGEIALSERGNQNTNYTFEFGYETPPSEQGERNFYIEMRPESKCLDGALLSPEPEGECSSSASSISAQPIDRVQCSFDDHEDFQVAQKSQLPYSTTTSPAVFRATARNRNARRIPFPDLDMDIERAFAQVKQAKTRCSRTSKAVVASVENDKEACLPLKKRRRATLVEEDDHSSREGSVSMESYPATPMISIAELAVMPRCGAADVTDGRFRGAAMPCTSFYRSTPPLYACNYNAIETLRQ